MASLPKGKQMVQRRLGLYRQVLQGHKSDTSIELQGSGKSRLVRRLMGLFCLWHSVSVLLSLKAVLGSGLLHQPFLLLGTARFGMEWGQVAVWKLVPLTGQAVPTAVALASWGREITKHNTAFWFSTAFLLLLMYTCRNVPSFLSWENGRTGGGHSRSWLLTQPGLYYNTVIQRLKFQEWCSRLHAARWAPASPATAYCLWRDVKWHCHSGLSSG